MKYELLQKSSSRLKLPKNIHENLHLNDGNEMSFHHHNFVDKLHLDVIESPQSISKNARASHSNFLTRIKHCCKCFFITLPKTRSKPLKCQK